MLVLKIPSMSCGHCVKTVTETVKAIDPHARVDIDLASKTAKIDTVADAVKVTSALAEAGYAPG